MLSHVCRHTREEKEVKKEGRGKERGLGDSRAGGGAAAQEQGLRPPATCAPRHPSPWERCLACRVHTELSSSAVAPYSSSSLCLQWKPKTSRSKGWQMSVKGMSALADKSLQTMGQPLWEFSPTRQGRTWPDPHSGPLRLGAISMAWEPPAAAPPSLLTQAQGCEFLMPSSGACVLV